MVLTISKNSIPVTSFNYDARFGELQNKIRKFEKLLGIVPSAELSIPAFSTPPRSGTGKSFSFVELPSWFLFHEEDIPNEFRNGPSDKPKDNDPHFLNKVAGWMNSCFPENSNWTCKSGLDYLSLASFIALNSSDNLEKKKDFIIAHEVAHIAHSKERKENLRMWSAAVVSTSIALFILFVVFVPIPATTVNQFIWGMVAVGSLCTSFASQYIWLDCKDSIPFSRIEEEKRADLDAVRILQDASGGIDYFTDTLTQNLFLLECKPEKGRFYIQENGNFLTDSDHPPLTERIEYLQAWQLEHKTS